jgi:hypothetical protein
VKTLRPLLLALSVSLLAILTACGGGGGGGNNTPIVSISGASSTIAPNGTFSLTATVTNDSGSAGVTWSLAGQGTLTNNTTTGVTYTAPASVPPSPSVTVTATSVADTNSSSSVTFLIAQPAEQVLQYINGQYAFEATGFDGANGVPLTIAGSITADGNGHITAGEIDVNDNLSTSNVSNATGTYTFDTNGRGTFVFSSSLGSAFSATPTFAFTIDLTSNSGTIASIDTQVPSVSGTLDKQTAAAFSATPSGAFIMRAISDNPQRAGLVGRFDVVGGGSMSNGFGDVSDVGNGNDAEDASLTGTFAISDAHGRGTNNTFNIAGVGGSQLVYYGISATKYYLFETGNSTTASQTQFVGVMRAQGSLTSSSPSGSVIFGTIGGDFLNQENFVGVVSSVAVGNMAFSGTSTTVTYDLNDAGAVNSSSISGTIPGTVTFDPTTGRGTIVFNGGFANGFIDSEVFYLEATGKGVMMDTTDFGDGNSFPESLVGDLVPQTSTSAVSGTIQGVELLGDAFTPGISTAASVSGGNIGGLQSGTLPTSIVAGGAVLTDIALGGTLGASDSTGRAQLLWNSDLYPDTSYPGIAYAYDATHFYVVQTPNDGNESTLGVYSAQSLPAVPAGIRASAHKKIVGNASKRAAPKVAAASKRHAASTETRTAAKKIRH